MLHGKTLTKKGSELEISSLKLEIKSEKERAVDEQESVDEIV